MKPRSAAYHTCEIHLKHIFGATLDFANYDQSKDGEHRNEIQPPSTEQADLHHDQTKVHDKLFKFKLVDSLFCKVFIGLAIMVYEPLYHDLQKWRAYA